MEDAIKWSDIVEGREDAYRLLYERFSDLLYGYGMKIVADEAMVVDAIQSLFMNIFEKRRHLAAPSSVAAYLCRSLKNILINEMNSVAVRRRDEYNDASAGDYDFELELDAECAMIANENERERYRLFQEELNKLSRQQREMLYLRYYKGLEIEEIAKILDVSKRTVYNTTNNAIARLRENKVLTQYFSKEAMIMLLCLCDFYVF